MLLPEAQTPKGHAGNGVRVPGGLSRGQMSAAALTCPCPQAAERHGSFEEHVRQLEGQLEEKKQELARVRARLGSEDPGSEEVGAGEGLATWYRDAGAGGAGRAPQDDIGTSEQGGSSRVAPGAGSGWPSGGWCEVGWLCRCASGRR